MADVVEDNKVCPSCAETVKRAAVRCRFCGHDFARSPSSNADPSRFAATVDKWVDDSSRRRQGGCGAPVGVVLALLIGAFLIFGRETDGGAGSQAESQQVQLVDKETAEKCRQLINQGERSGILRKVDKAGGRLYVDERSWQELGPDARKGVAGAAVCDWFGIKIGSTNFDTGVTIVSWQSGKSLSAIANGMYFDNMD